jgi:hypothetical protein
VDATAGIAEAVGEARFDGRVAVFILFVQHETPGAEVFGQHLQLALQAGQLVGAEDADVGQALGVRGTGGDVMQEELAIEDDVIPGEEGLDFCVDRDARLLPQKVCHAVLHRRRGPPVDSISAGSR